MTDAQLSGTVAEKKTVIPVFDLEGKSVGSKQLRPDIFGVAVNQKTLRQYIHVYLKNQRQGNAATKTRGEVNATTKKLYRQKGTGGARHGSRRAPIFVGGGVVFGPQPRDIVASINKKQKRIALLSSLTAKSQSGGIACLSNAVYSMQDPQTKLVATFLKNQELDSKKVLLVVDSIANNFVRSARNLKNVDIAEVYSLNAYDVLNHEVVVFTEQALDSLATHFLKTS